MKQFGIICFCVIFLVGSTVPLSTVTSSKDHSSNHSTMIAKVTIPSDKSSWSLNLKRYILGKISNVTWDKDTQIMVIHSILTLGYIIFEDASVKIPIPTLCGRRTFEIHEVTDFQGIYNDYWINGVVHYNVPIEVP